MASVVALSITVAAPYPSAAAAASAPTKGVDIDYVANVDSETQSWIRQHAVAAAAFIKQLGGNTALVAFPLFTASYRSNKIYTGVDPSATAYRTPTTAELGTLITELQSAGLKVNVRPLLDEGTLEPNNWRGSLAPTNRAAWFTTYRAAILPYLELSQKLHVNAFTVQSELQSLNSDPHWTSLIAWAHTHFSGPLVWNPDLVRYEQGVISRPGTITSFDYYPIVNLPSTATVAQLVAGWNSWWALVPRPLVPMQTTMAEVDILAQDGVYPTPWEHSAPGAFNQSVQANWFAAACQFSRQHEFGGIMFWNLNFEQSLPSLTTPNPASPQTWQPLALSAIKSCFAG